ncbi:RnfABCDGE type electron transport complex subunit D [Kaarinaea lacus]
MAEPKVKIELRTSPHLRPAPSVQVIMRNVVYALLPVCGYSVYTFGISALALIVTVILACLLAERLINQLGSNPSSLNDYSAVITGILLALTLPPGFPLWMAAVAGFIAIGLGKALFGGLGFNVFNPALVGRAFVQAAFPTAITTWTPANLPNRFVEFIPSTFTLPFTIPPSTEQWSKAASMDSFSGATPLALQKFENIATDTTALFTGAVSGSAGETCAWIILLCGAYLALRRFMDWRIPVAVLGSAVLLAWLLQILGSDTYPSPSFVLLSGGLILGAVFMATDMVGSPVTPLGVWIYGALIGIVTVVIRQFGGLTEGVMYAILLGNACAPLIDSITQPKPFGTKKAKMEQ